MIGRGNSSGGRGIYRGGGTGNVVVAAAEAGSSDKSLLVYIGTYTGAKSQGIYVARFDPASGRLGSPSLAAKSTVLLTKSLIPAPLPLAW